MNLLCGLSIKYFSRNEVEYGKGKGCVPFQGRRCSQSQIAIQSEGGVGGTFGASIAFAPERSGSGSRRGLPALRACPKVSTRGTRKGLAICVPRNAFEPRPRVGQDAPSPCQ